VRLQGCHAWSAWISFNVDKLMIHIIFSCLSEIFKICPLVAFVTLTCLLLSSRMILAKMKVHS
jgi:hypothetical protein